MATRILTYGTFDLFHVGHVRLLKRLSQLGDEVIVGCSTDEFNAQKGNQTVIPFAQRKECLEACRYVTKVIAEHDWDQKRDDVLRERADIFAMGDDWSGHFDDLQDAVKVIYLPRTENISSTELKGYLSTLQNEKVRVVQELTKRLASCVEDL